MDLPFVLRVFMEEWEAPGAAILLAPETVKEVGGRTWQVMEGLRSVRTEVPTLLLQGSVPPLGASKTHNAVISDSACFYYDGLTLKLCLPYSESQHSSKTSLYYYSLSWKILAESIWEAEAVLDLSLLV